MPPGATRSRLHPDDGAFLDQALTRLPGAEDDDSPITFDCNSPPTVRARAASDAAITELVLARSQTTGRPIRINVNRHLLARAVALGFREFVVVGADKPILCADAGRQFVFMPLSKEQALAPTDNAVRIVSDRAPTTPQLSLNRRSRPMREPSETIPMLAPAASAAASVPRSASNGPAAGDLVEEVLALRNLLHDACGRVARLVAAVKQQRRQAQIVRSTLKSLQQLRHG
ncbi:MAG: hypothetical protein K2R98_31700 [Gemmataceae bacterium]|nr:hypothetical protein [Gemmataceae bacterium]